MTLRNRLEKAFEERDRGRRAAAPRRVQTDIQVQGSVVVASLSGNYNYDQMMSLSCVLASRWTPGDQTLVINCADIRELDPEGARFFITSIDSAVEHRGLVFLVKAPIGIRRHVIRCSARGRIRCVSRVSELTSRTQRPRPARRRPAAGARIGGRALEAVGA